MILKLIKRFGSFIAIMILIHAIGAIFFALSDYFLCWYFNKSCERYPLFERSLTYFVLNFGLSLYTGFFLIIIILMIAKSKYNLSFRKMAVIGCVCGGLFALNTYRSIWSLYIYSPEKEYRYIVVVLVTMCLSPYIIHLFRKYI
jgi:uncharacterized membrane protein